MCARLKVCTHGLLLGEQLNNLLGAVLLGELEQTAPLQFDVRHLEQVQVVLVFEQIDERYLAVGKAIKRETPDAFRNTSVYTYLSSNPVRQPTPRTTAAKRLLNLMAGVPRRRRGFRLEISMPPAITLRTERGGSKFSSRAPK